MNAKQTRIATLVSALFTGTAVWATPPASSPYNTDLPNEYVQDATSDGIDNVNMVLCIMNAMQPAAMVNAGPYVALVDKNKCDNKQRSSSSNSAGGASGATAAASYMNAVVDVTRVTNADPMIAKVWMSMTENGHATDIYVSINATQSPTDAPPYGKFRLDYIGKVSGATQFNGYIDTTTTGVLNYLETGQNSSNVALALSASSTTAGAGTMTTGNPVASTFNFAYDSNNFRRSDGTNDQCFDRQKANASRSVWRYGTYNANDGTRVDVTHPGFPVQATRAGISYFGFASYWGINFQGLDLNALGDSASVSGLVISDQRTGNTTAYTLGKVGGKLTQWTRHQNTLAAIDGVPFNFGADLTARTTPAITPPAGSFPNWQAHWDQATTSFVVTGAQTCGNNGCVVASVGPATVDPTFMSNMPLSGWSDSLGGNINIPPSNGSPHTGTDAVYYYDQAAVIPGSAALTLYCLSQCPTTDSISSFTSSPTSTSPFGAGTAQQWFSAASATNSVTYAFDAGGLEHNNGSVNTPMVLTSSTVFAGTPYQNGIMTGRLFTSALTNADCPSFMPGTTVCEPANPVTYYTWQTGPNPWDQSLWLTPTGSTTPVVFDPPQNIAYQITSLDDPSGAWVGKNIQLQFNGFGNLFGIPGSCVNPVDNSPADCNTPNVRYVPSFGLKDGDTMTLGSTQLIVKGLDAELRLGKVALSVCTGANLNLSALTPPSAAPADPSVTNGPKPPPTVNGGNPKVIDGVVVQ